MAALGEAIEFRAAVVLRFAPTGVEPAGFFHPMESGKERAGLDLKRVFRDLGDASGDPQAVHRLEGEHFKNEDIERALEQGDIGGRRHLV